MARPVSIKDETIIEAARQVFLERGILATTADVAERAGVSEGSIFKRYKSKLDLFRAAMRFHLGEPAWAKNLAGRAGKGEIEEQLFEIGIEVVTFFRQLMPLIMMSWSNPGPDGMPIMVERGPNAPPIRALRQMQAYFEAEMKLGRIRHHAADVTARTFLGALMNYVFFEVIHRDPGAPEAGLEAYVRGLVGLLWTGLSPTPPSAGR